MSMHKWIGRCDIIAAHRYFIRNTRSMSWVVSQRHLFDCLSIRAGFRFMVIFGRFFCEKISNTCWMGFILKSKSGVFAATHSLHWLVCSGCCVFVLWVDILVKWIWAIQPYCVSETHKFTISFLRSEAQITSRKQPNGNTYQLSHIIRA